MFGVRLNKAVIMREPNGIYRWDRVVDRPDRTDRTIRAPSP